jgi:hypothetical protein
MLPLISQNVTVPEPVIEEHWLIGRALRVHRLVLTAGGERAHEGVGCSGSDT